MKSPELRLAWALRICREAQMRLTPVRERILEFFAVRRVPSSLDAVTQADGIRGSCNFATVYRALMLLCELEVLRPVGMPDKSSYFILNSPGESGHFLVCRCCGAVSELQPAQSIAALEQEITAVHGYTRLYHELVFSGICPACQKHPPGVVCAKVQPKMRLSRGLKPGSATSS